MSAVLAGASAVFSYQGASVTLSCSSPEELKNALATFGIGAANDTPTPKKDKPAATPAPTPAPHPQGNASASTGTQASAPPADSGSAAGGEAQRPTYKEVSERITTLCKKPGGREKCLALLATFTGMSGQPVDHGNKLKLEDYPSFIEKIDATIGSMA